MSFAGNWNIEINSPMGLQKATANISVDGGKLSGQFSSPQGQMPIEGTVDGDKATFVGKATSPMPMTLEYEATLSGDAFSGTMKAGSFGKFNFKGARA
jgi:hypothetical protein